MDALFLEYPNNSNIKSNTKKRREKIIKTKYHKSNDILWQKFKIKQNIIQQIIMNTILTMQQIIIQMYNIILGNNHVYIVQRFTIDIQF